MRGRNLIGLSSFKLRPRTYIVLCVLVCVFPIWVVLSQFFLGVPRSISRNDDLLFALLGTFAAAVLTYPTGVLATIASYVPVYFRWLTWTEAVLLAAPIYIATGYLQWYVLKPALDATQRQHN
jgi:hypothetical protein